MSALAHLCGVADAREVVVAPAAAQIRALVDENAVAGYALLEPDLPLAKLALPRDPVDRAVLALVTRGAPRALLFAPGTTPKLARVKEERALDLVVTLVAPFGGNALAEAASAVLAARGPLPGKELLREARARRGGANTKDAPDLGRALVRAWAAGLVDLAPR